jgi:hypothetical protein
MLIGFLSKGVRHAAYVTILFTFLGFPSESRATSGAPILLVWSASNDPTVTGYNIYYGSASRSYTNAISAGSLTSATVSNLLAGSTYYFAATSYTLAGLESDFSAEASYTVPTSPILAAATIGGSSRNLTIKALLGNTYQVQYTTNLGPAAIWYPLATYTQTNFVQSFNLAPSLSPVFYRVEQK